MDVVSDIDIDKASRMVGVLLTPKSGATREQARQALADIIIKEIGADWSQEHPGSSLLLIKLSCGGSASYQVAEDIPLVDVPCPCGDPTHWLLRYEEED